jgi:hypothetical protein
MLVCRTCSIKASSSSLSIGFVYIRLDGIRSTSVHLFENLVEPLFSRLFSCVSDCVCRSFRTASSIRFFLSCKLSGSGSDAPNSSASSSWWYIVATFLSFRRSTAKRLSSCGVVLLARLILYLKPHHKRVFTLMMSEKCRRSSSKEAI